MRKYLLSEKGNFYRANLHCHTTVSDGKHTPEQIKQLYKSRGYSIVAFTDHDVMIDHSYLDDADFLALRGYEMEITETRDIPSFHKKTAHLCAIALSRDVERQVCFHREKYMIGSSGDYKDRVKFDESLPDYVRVYSHEGVSDVMSRARSGGFFVTYNHPTWSNENYSDYIGYSGMHAMEIYNGACITSGYEDINSHAYDDILRSGKRIYAIGADDNHNFHPDHTRRSDSCVAATVIKAPALEYEAITQALLDGNFYATMGPEIKELYFEDGRIHVRTSPADRIIMTTAGRRRAIEYREKGRALTSASFAVSESYSYVRITVIDKAGKRADTNAYFTDELFSQTEK